MVHLWDVNVRVEDCDEIDTKGLLAELKTLSKDFDCDEDGYEYWCEVYGEVFSSPQTMWEPGEYEEELEFEPEDLQYVLSEFSKDHKISWERPLV